MMNRLFLLFSSVVLAGLTMRCEAAGDYVWRNVVIGGGGFVSGIEYHPAVEGLMYARTDVGGVYRRDSPEGPWIPLNDSLGGLDNEFMLQGVLSMALDQKDADRVYLACGQYTADWAPAACFMASTDRGATWRRTPLPFKLGGNENGRGTGERLAVDPRDGTRLFLGTTRDGLWRSVDRGDHWRRLEGFTPAGTTFVRCDPALPGVLYVGAAQAAGGTLWKSVDGGDTWAAVPGQPDGLIALQAAFGKERELYLTFSNALGPNGATAGAVWKLDAGGAWTSLHVPGEQSGFGGLSVSSKVPGRILVSTLDRWGPKDDVYRSDDGGKTWVPILANGTLDFSSAPWAGSLTPHWITDVEMDPFHPERASFVTGYGIFSTSGLGNPAVPAVWKFDNQGLEETVVSAVVSPATGPPLVSTIGDFDGFRHDDLTVSPPAGRHAPSHGSSQSLDGAGVAPNVLARLHGATGSLSKDGARTWKAFPATPPAAAAADGRIAVSADGSRLLWCGKEWMPYVSPDEGATWIAAKGCPAGKLRAAADREDPLSFAVYDMGTGGVFVSRDGGETFLAADEKLPPGGTGIEAVPGQRGHLWLTAGKGGLWHSVNGGQAFRQVSSVECGYQIGFGKAAKNGDYPVIYLYGRIKGVDGVFRSDDGGATWVRINDDAHQFGGINDLTGDSRVHGRVYLATGGRGVVFGEPPAR